jgi:hypothetical protein
VTDPPVIKIGNVWQHKREPWRRVMITYIYESGDLAVDRNTSRRGQSIKPETLRASYRLTDRSTL